MLEVLHLGVTLQRLLHRLIVPICEQDATVVCGESQLTDRGSDFVCNVDVTFMKPLYKEPTLPTCISHFLIFQQKIPASFS